MGKVCGVIAAKHAEIENFKANGKNVGATTLSDNILGCFRYLSENGASVHISWRRIRDFSWNRKKIAVILSSKTRTDDTNNNKVQTLNFKTMTTKYFNAKRVLMSSEGRSVLMPVRRPAPLINLINNY